MIVQCTYSTLLRDFLVNNLGHTVQYTSILIDYTDKKEDKIFLINKEIQSGAVAKSYMRNDFLIYEVMCKYLVTYEEAISHIRLCNCSLMNFLIYE